MIFETERLIVRQWTEQDAEAAFQIYRHPEVSRYLGRNAKAMESVDEMAQRIRFWRERDKGLRTELGFWAMEDRQLGPLGSVILRPLPNDTKVEVGWHLGFDHWGKGYATEAGAGAVKHGFEVVGLDEIYAIVQPENSRSIAVTQRLGMEPLGITNSYHEMALLLFRLLRSESSRK
jgi:RimJ/RimL family protein N-acetyltransferase